MLGVGVGSVVCGSTTVKILVERSEDIGNGLSVSRRRAFMCSHRRNQLSALVSFDVGDVFQTFAVVDSLFELSLLIVASKSLELFPDLPADCLALC